MAKISSSKLLRKFMKFYRMCRKLDKRVKILEAIESNLKQNSEAQNLQFEVVEAVTQSNPFPVVDDFSLEEKLFPDFKNQAKYIGYMTICSSVQTSGKQQDIMSHPQGIMKKAALSGATNDVARLENYLLKLGPIVHRQAKYEFSAESVSAASKEEFLKSLNFFFENIKNESCLLFYSGHGLKDTSLVFETSVENYHVKYWDVVSQWKVRRNLKNKHFFLVLDCCFSGSWVIELFKNGDFKDVSIQGSSTYDQTSNDLGADLGSLFTSMISKENGLKIELEVTNPIVISAMNSQTPMAFCSKWGISQKIFNKVGFNSWDDLTLLPKTRVVKSTNGITSIFKERLDSPSNFEHIAIIIEKERLILQGDIKLKGRVSVLLNLKRQFTSNMIGIVSVWTRFNEIRGIFFRQSKEKNYSFEIPIEALLVSVDYLKQWITELDKFDSLDAKLDLLDKALKIMTEINKNNLIQSDNYDEENEEEIDYDSLKIESLSPLESLSITGELKNESLSCIFGYLLKSISSLKNLKLENFSCALPKLKPYQDLNSISIKITKDSSIQTLNAVKTIIPFYSKVIEIEFDENSLNIALCCHSMFTNFSITSKLRSLKINNVFSHFYKDLKDAISRSLSLVEVSFEKCAFTKEQSNELLQLIFLKPSILSIALIKANLSMNVQPHSFVTYLNLSGNFLTSNNVSPIFGVKFSSRYSIDLSNNIINSNIISGLSAFLRENKLCNEFNLSGNFVAKNVAELARINLLYKCTVVTLNLSNTDLSGVELKNFNTLICKASQLKHLILSRCKLTSQQLSDILLIVRDDSINSITSIDISYNKICDESFYNVLRRRVKSTKSIQTLLMAGCVDIVSKKPLTTDGYFNAASVCKVDYSSWNSTFGFEVSGQISKSITEICLKDFSFTPASKLNLKDFDIESLEVDNNTFEHLILPKTCKQLKLIELTQENISLANSIMGIAQSLHIVNANLEINDSCIQEVLPISSISEVEQLVKSEGPYSLQQLIIEDADEGSALYMIEEVGEKDDRIQQYSIKSSTGQNLSIASNKIFASIENTYSISDELFRILNNRSFYDMSLVQIVNTPQTEFMKAAKCLCLRRNCFNSKLLGEFKFDDLEIIELNSTYVKGLIPILEMLVSNNQTIKVILIKDSEMNLQEIQTLINMLKSLKSSIEELHLVNTFVDSKEIKCLLVTLLECSKLSTLNLSGNSIPKKLIYDFAKSHNPLDTLILRNCSFTTDQVHQALEILNYKSMRIIDISGFRLSYETLKDLISSESQWNLLDLRQCYTLEVSYSSKAFYSHCSHLLKVLHLNQINFELSSSLVKEIFESINCLNALVITKCSDENNFMKYVFLLTKLTKIHTLDISGNLMTKSNIDFLVRFIENQLNHLSNSELQINLSSANLEDVHFELLYNYVMIEDKSSYFNVDLSHNMLTGISAKLIDLLPDNKKSTFEINQQGAFGGEFDQIATQDLYYDLKTMGRINQYKYNEVKLNLAKLDENSEIKCDCSVQAIVVIIEDFIACGNSDGGINVWQLSAKACMMTFKGHTKQIASLALLNSDTLISTSENHDLKVWLFSTAACILTLELGVYKGLAILNEDIIAISQIKTIEIWQISSGKCLKSIYSQQHMINVLETINDDCIASGSEDCSIKIWMPSISKCLFTLDAHDLGVTTLTKLGSSENYMISGSKDKTIKLWSLSSQSCLFDLTGHQASIRAIVVLNEMTIISGSDDKTVRIWDLKSRKCLKVLEGHKESVQSLAIVNEDLLVSSSADNSIREWRFKPNSTIDPRNIGFEDYETLYGHKKLISSIAAFGDDLIASGSYDCTIKIWDIITLNCVKTLEGHSNNIRVLIKLKKDYLVSGSYDNTIKLWKVSSGECIQSFEGHTAPINDVIRINDDLIASGSYDKYILVWQISTSLCIAKYKNDKSLCRLLKFSDDIILFGSDKIIKLWQLSSNKILSIFAGHEDTGIILEKINDNCFVSAAFDKTVKLWNISGTKCIMSVKLDSRICSTFTKFSDDLLLLGCSDGSIILMKLSSGEIVSSLKCHDSDLSTVLKLNDYMIVTAADELKLWNCKLKIIADATEAIAVDDDTDENLESEQQQAIMDNSEVEAELINEE